MGKPKIHTQDNGTVVADRATVGGVLRRDTRCSHLGTETKQGVTTYSNGIHDLCHACLLQGTPFANIDEYWRNIARRHAARWEGQ